jgi:hypothetical protein
MPLTSRRFIPARCEFVQRMPKQSFLINTQKILKYFNVSGGFTSRPHHKTIYHSLAQLVPWSAQPVIPMHKRTNSTSQPSRYPFRASFYPGITHFFANPIYPFISHQSYPLPTGFQFTQVNPQRIFRG